MKDIFEILNNADIRPEEECGVTFTKEEQDKLFHLITKKDENMNKKKKYMKKILASAAVLGTVIVTAAFRPNIETLASNIMAYFTDNTKTDYKEEVHENVEQDTGDMELMSVSREERTIYLKVKFTFMEDVSELTQLCGDYKSLGFYMITNEGELKIEGGTVLIENCSLNEDLGLILEDGTVVEDKYVIDYLMENCDIPEEALVDANYNAPEGYVLDAPPFKNSSILVNGFDIYDWFKFHPDSEDPIEANFPVFSMSVRNIEVSGNTLVQGIELTLQEDDYAGEIDIAFRYKDIELSDRVVEGEWNLDYTISNDGYEEGELNRMPIELSAADLYGTSYKLESYSVTPAGIKFYGQDESRIYYEEHKDDVISEAGVSSNVRLTAYDDLGNKYLLYPLFDEPKNPVGTACVYYIYAGPADFNDEYLDRLDSDAKTLTIAYEEIRHPYDENGHFVGEEELVLISEELTVEIGRGE